MKAAILIKQVPDHEANITIASEKSLNIEDRYVCSLFDEIAIEAALNLKRDHPETELTAFSAGGKKSVDALRRAIAMGVDNVFHLGDESLDEADNLFLAKVLATKLHDYSPDLILCGKQAADDEMAAVGPMVAELLKIPNVCDAVSLELDNQNRKIRVDRSFEGEVWALDSPLPLLISADKGLSEPHVPTVTRVMKAMKAKIENVSLSELGLDSELEQKVIRKKFVDPPVRPEVTMIDDPFPDNVTKMIQYLQENGYRINPSN